MTRTLPVGSLHTRLLVLVLVPLTGVLAYTAAAVSVGARQSADAAQAERSVVLLGQLGAARSAVVQEIVPSFSVALTRDPALARAFGMDTATRRQLAAAVQVRLSPAREASDRALGRLPADGPAAEVVRSTREGLQSLRETVDEGRPDLSLLAEAHDEMVQDLADAEHDAVAAAVSQGLEPPGVRALSDVQLVADAMQAGNPVLPSFLGTRVPGATADDRREFLAAWGAYRSLSGQIDRLSSPDLRSAWTAVVRDPDVRGFQYLLDDAVGARRDAWDLDLSQMVELQRQSQVRDAALAGVLAQAVDRAVDATAAQRDGALHRLRLAVALSAALLVVALGLVALCVRWVTRPLRRLAGDAQQISEGRLLDVDESGPREVRTVARALSAAVASLRRVQGQAQAVASGELDADVLRQPLPGPLGDVVHASFQRVTDAIRSREQLQSDLAHQAAHDSLTMLPNRATALRLLEGALHRAQRSGAAVALLFVDLDHFKDVNDTYGHAAGDEVLRAVSQRLEREVRSGDVVCRLGGDEFVVLMEPVEAEDAPVQMASRLLGALAVPVQVGDVVVRVGASIGISVSRDGSTDAGRLLREADAAAYRAKASGRGGAELFDDALRRELVERAELEAAIAAGLDDDEFVLHYQPVVDVMTGRVRGFEALMRWQRPGHGLVAPGAFIPTAERSSLVCQLGRWALVEAACQLAAWDDGGPDAAVPPDATVAVNISGRHLFSAGVVDDVAAALAASELEPQRLVLELTETVMVDDPVAVDRLLSLRALGVRIALDDFGTGYTSIGQLQRLPVDTLKIDRGFVASPDPRHRELVRLIVSAAHTFRLDVVAEGVEEPVQLERLREVQCDAAQGFLISRPMPSASFSGSAPPGLA